MFSSSQDISLNESTNDESYIDFNTSTIMNNSINTSININKRLKPNYINKLTYINNNNINNDSIIIINNNADNSVDVTDNNISITTPFKSPEKKQMHKSVSIHSFEMKHIYLYSYVYLFILTIFM